MEEMGGGDQRSENGTSENEILEVAPLLLAGSTRTRVEELGFLNWNRRTQKMNWLFLTSPKDRTQLAPFEMQRTEANSLHTMDVLGIRPTFLSEPHLRKAEMVASTGADSQKLKELRGQHIGQAIP